jgi:hypothetical protein
MASASHNFLERENVQSRHVHEALSAHTTKQLKAKYPDLAFSKGEQDGLFFEIGETIVSVYAKTEYFSR